MTTFWSNELIKMIHQMAITGKFLSNKLVFIIWMLQNAFRCFLSSLSLFRSLPLWLQLNGVRWSFANLASIDSWVWVPKRRSSFMTVVVYLCVNELLAQGFTRHQNMLSKHTQTTRKLSFFAQKNAIASFFTCRVLNKIYFIGQANIHKCKKKLLVLLALNLVDVFFERTFLILSKW